MTVRRTSGTVRLGTAPAFKFLTVRNLLTLTPRRSYDCVSANSLQWLQALHGSAPAVPLRIVTVRRTRS